MNNNIKILVIDDEQNVLDLIQAVLEKEGYQVYTALDEKAASAVFYSEHIDIILLDIALPGRNGYEICEEFRSVQSGKPLQIILMSGLMDDPLLSQSLEAGGDDFFRKPFSPLEILTRIQAAIIRLHGQQEVFREAEFFKKAAEQKAAFSTLVLQKNQQLEQEKKDLEMMVNYDDLSGLLNRKSLFSRLDLIIQRSREEKFPLTGIMIDLDHFKLINDEYGHQCGDIVLKETCKLLSSILRKEDIAGRYGGEEFFVALPNIPLKQGAMIAERYRQALEKKAIHWANTQIKLTASLGVTCLLDFETRDRWLHRTDKAMYLSKQIGRNTVTADCPSSQEIKKLKEQK